MISGLNHVTLAVGDLARAIDFYGGLLGFTIHARWAQGAYLSAGDLWLCLSLDTPSPATDYTHLALSADACRIDDCRAHLLAAGVQQWKDNTSEGDSLYFLDPDGHKLELHAGTLSSRLAAIADAPYDELQLFSP